MKSLVLVIAILAGITNEGTETLEVNVRDSKINWTGAKVGGSHNGTIQLKEGRLEMSNGVLTGGSFKIDMTTIVNEDLSGEYKGKLEGHLKSDDFFGVEKYPTADFTITNAVPQGPGKYKITGNLTIKGITKEIKFPAVVEMNGGNYIATADITVDRSEFNVRYGSGSFFDDLGDKVIYDNFDLSVSLTAAK